MYIFEWLVDGQVMTMCYVTLRVIPSPEAVHVLYCTVLYGSGCLLFEDNVNYFVLHYWGILVRNMLFTHFSTNPESQPSWSRIRIGRREQSKSYISKNRQNRFN